MKNLDKMKTLEEIKVSMNEAMKNADMEAFTKAQEEMVLFYQEQTLQQAKALSDERAEELALANQGGHRVLTSEEKKFYNAITISGGLDASATIPTTIVERVLEDIQKEHPLLSKINFENTTGMREFIVKKGKFAGAKWGKIDSEIKKEVEGGFTSIKTNILKLSAFTVIGNDMKKVGPQWLDKYIRTVLAEAIAMELENGIINGNGSKEDGNEMPVGMMMNLQAGLSGSAYQEQSGVAIKDFSVATIGKIMAAATKNETINMPEVVCIVNPEDYWNIILKSIYKVDANGKWESVLPFNLEFIGSSAVKKGKMVVGNPKKYFAGIEYNAKIAESDEYRFLEDQTVYKTSLLGTFTPIEKDDFIVYDFSGIREV